MSNKNFKLITFEEFAEYLNSLPGDHTCPLCCEESWMLYTPNELTPGDDEDREIMVPTIPGAPFKKNLDEKGGGLYKTPALDVLIMQCQNCGFINFLNYRKVEQNLVDKNYIKANDDKADGDETA